MIPVNEALQRLAARAHPLDTRDMPVSDAVGLHLAEAVRSDVDIPHADVSAMDGYALRHTDLEAGEPLTVEFEVAAGDPLRELPAGKAARIFTGAVLPAGADTVVQQEKAEVLEDGRVKLETVKPGKDVRRQGEVVAKGDSLAQPGDAITPQRVALFASGGSDWVKVIPRPRVSILLTGSELVAAGETPRSGETRDSNGPMLEALAGVAGFPVIERHRAVDRLDDLVDQMRQATIASDLVITTGGVSVGDYDLVPKAVEELGGDIIFHKVFMKPGKPILAAKIGSAWLVGLPGNPVSALVGWRLFARRIGHALAGNPRAFKDDSFTAKLTEPAANKGKRPVYLPAVVEVRNGKRVVTSIAWKGSHDLRASAGANALLLLDVGAQYDAGEPATCYLL